MPLFELQDVTLLVHAYQKYNIKRKDLIGWLALGANSSGEEQLAHWNDMMEAKGDQVSARVIISSSKSIVASHTHTPVTSRMKCCR